MLASPAEDAAEIIAPARSRGLGRGQVRRHPGPAPQARVATSGSTRATSTTSATSSPRSSRRPGRCAWTGVIDGEILGLQGRPRAAVHQPPGAARAQVAVGADPGRHPGRSTSPSTCWRSGPATTPTATRTVEPLLREPLRERRARLDAHRPATVDDGGRFTRSYLAVARDEDALEAAFADARGRRNEGLMVKDPDERLLAGPARPGLAEDEEGARDDRLRGRRRRGRARQAPRRAERLHVRRPRRGRPASSSTSARRTAA